MSARDEAAARYAEARRSLAEIVGALVALRVEVDAEALALATAEFIARTRWPERTAKLAIEAEIRKSNLTPEELEIETARLRLRLREAGLELTERAP